MTHCVSFPAVAAADARILILGSLPGAESLKRGEYYAKKQNAFWKIMGALTGAAPELPYPDRLACLKSSGIALWNVCASAYRPGSLDANIDLATLQPNVFTGFFKRHRAIRLICFNGQPAEKIFRRTVLPGLVPELAALRREILPSTSPAHAGLCFEEKLSKWRAVLYPALAAQTLCSNSSHKV